LNQADLEAIAFLILLEDAAAEIGPAGSRAGVSGPGRQIRTNGPGAQGLDPGSGDEHRGPSALAASTVSHNRRKGVADASQQAEARRAARADLAWEEVLDGKGEGKRARLDTSEAEFEDRAVRLERANTDQALTSSRVAARLDEAEWGQQRTVAEAFGEDLVAESRTNHPPPRLLSVAAESRPSGTSVTTNQDHGAATDARGEPVELIDPGAEKPRPAAVSYSDLLGRATAGRVQAALEDERGVGGAQSAPLRPAIAGSLPSTISRKERRRQRSIENLASRVGALERWQQLFSQEMDEPVAERFAGRLRFPA